MAEVVVDHETVVELCIESVESLDEEEVEEVAHNSSELELGSE